MKLKNILKSSLIAIALSSSGCQLNLMDEINIYHYNIERYLDNKKSLDNKNENKEDIESEYYKSLLKYKNPNRFVKFARN